LKTDTWLKRLVPFVAVGAVLAYSFLFRGAVSLNSSPLACGYGQGSGTCGWMNLGGILASGPDATSSAIGNASVFVQGQDRQLWYRTTNNSGSTFTPWTPLGGLLIGSPGAEAQSTGQIDVFIRGQDNQLWQKEFTPGGSGGFDWTPLGGILTSAPDVTSIAPGHLDVFAVGQDRQLWQRSFNGTSWGGWTPLGGILTAKPSATAMSGAIDVFGRGQDGQLWEKSFFTDSGALGPTWHEWAPLGGILKAGTGPDADSRVAQGGTGKHDLFIDGQDNQLWEKSSSSGTWGPWQPAGGILTAEPGVAYTGSMDAVFVRGQDNALYWSPVSSAP
jgi:hypothetical protein